MIIKHLKSTTFGAVFMLANHSTLQAMIQEVSVLNEDNIVVAATLEKILEQAAGLLSDEEKDNIREMQSALVYFK